MDIDKIIDDFFGGDVFLKALVEVAGEILSKNAVDEIRNLYREAGSDRCNLIQTNYDRGFKVIYN
ncbi:MAG: hypothetical protein Q8N99_05205 [Nanoarchaeota archaeon]|nr:hypothetical protein [Nanoarchaeota archaeon]